MSLSNILLPSETCMSIPIGRTSRLVNSQKHRSTLPAYPHAAQEFFIISWWRDAFPRSYCGRRSPLHTVIYPFPDLFDHTRLGIRDEEE